MISLVTIDCWGTILEDNSEWDGILLGHVHRVLAASAGGAWTLKDSLAAFRQEASGFSATLSAESRTPSISSRIASLFGGAGVPLLPENVEDLRNAFEGVILSPPPKLVQGVELFLRRVKAADVHVCLVCNTGWFSSHAIVRALQHHDVYSCLDRFLFSDEVGVAKPSPHIFNRARDLFNCPGECAVHVGDNLQRDVTGALESGQRAIHFHPRGRCHSQLWSCASNYEDLWGLLAQQLGPCQANRES